MLDKLVIYDQISIFQLMFRKLITWSNISIHFLTSIKKSFIKKTVELYAGWSMPGAANPGPAGHFWPARTFKMARKEFLADTGWTIEV
jgi:hypothetical protein